MAPEGRYLAQREQHERPPVHLWVGQLQLAAPPPSVRVADLPAAEVEDIDVQLPRPPPAAKPAASLPLDALEEFAAGRRRDVDPSTITTALR